MSESSLVSKCDLRSAECPCCLKIFEPPIFMCSSGHSLCKKCSQNVVNCPLCREKVSTTQRNYQLEEVVNSFMVNCDHCHLEMKKLELDEHSKNQCKYRSLKCPLSGCGREIPWLNSQIFSHYTGVFHNFSIASKKPWRVQCDLLENIVIGPRLAKFDGVEFLAKFQMKLNTIFIWLAVLRVDSKVDDYQSVFKIYKSDPKKVGIMFTSKVYSIRDTLEQLESKIFLVKIDTLKHQLDLQDTKSVFWIEIKIKKNK